MDWRTVDEEAVEAGMGDGLKVGADRTFKV